MLGRFCGGFYYVTVKGSSELPLRLLVTRLNLADGENSLHIW